MSNIRIPALSAVAVALMFTFGAQAAEQGMAQQHTPNMHRPQVTGEMSNSEIAASYTAEATGLRETAKMHRKMATHFKGRDTLGGKLNFSGTVLHCNKLADTYETAAKEADAVASDLSK